MIEKKTIIELAQERIDELNKGLYIVEVSVKGNNLIRVELDAEEGNVSINDCVSVSRNIEHNLDREKQDFELKVSSAGLDKPLRVIQQFKKNKGREVVVLLDENNKSIKGTLVEVQEDGICIEREVKERIEGKKKKIKVIKREDYKFDKIKETKVVISFKR